MDAARQVVRWSTPGWILILTFSCFQALTQIVQGSTPMQLLSSEAIKGISAASVALLVTAGIPLGFLVYQIYYAWYGNVLPLYLVNMDRGADVLESLPEEVCGEISRVTGRTPSLEPMYDELPVRFLRFPLRRLKRENRNNDGKERYETKLQSNWEIIRAYLNYVCFSKNCFELKQEVTTLADIYHGIGATRMALFLSCGLHLIYNAYLATTKRVPIGWIDLFAILLPYVLAFILFRVLERTRTHTLVSLLSILKSIFFWSIMDREQSRDSAGTE